MQRNTENVLQFINKNYITVADGEVKQNNQLLGNVLDKITGALGDVSPLFNNLFNSFVYGGSMYNGLKVSKPDRFNIDLKLTFPIILDVEVQESNVDGFVYLKLKEWSKFITSGFFGEIHNELRSLIDAENYLSQQKVLYWMESILTRAITHIENNSIFDIYNIEISQKKKYPAITLAATYNYQKIYIDLVIAFGFSEEKWLELPTRRNTSKIHKQFLVVPKAPKEVVENNERYWRLSYPEQEKEKMNGLNFCKPALRLLKKLRDTRNHNIPSYFITTVFLWEIEKRESMYDEVFWNSSLKNVFLDMLEIYKKYLESGRISYFWNSNNNLLNRSSINIKNIENYLNKMIIDVKRNINSDPLVIAKYLLPQHEFQQLKKHFSNEDSDDGIIHAVRAIPSHSSFPSSSNRNVVKRKPDQETSLLSNNAVGIGAIGIGIAAVLGGMYALSRRDRNN